MTLNIMSTLASYEHPTTGQEIGTEWSWRAWCQVTVVDDALQVWTTLQRKERVASKIPVKVKRPAKTMLFNVPVSEIQGIDIEALTQDHSRGWKASTGFIGSGKRMPGTTGVLITTNRGWLMFEDMMPALQSKAIWSPLISQVGNSATA